MGYVSLSGPLWGVPVHLLVSERVSERVSGLCCLKIISCFCCQSAHLFTSSVAGQLAYLLL